MTASRSKKNELVVSSALDALRRLPQESLPLRYAVLGAVVITAAAVVLPLGVAISGNRNGFLAGAAAGGVCLLAAWTALGLCEPFRRPKHMLAFVLVGMMIRIGIPLAAALTVYFIGGPLADAGFLYYAIVFYPLTLAVETFLSLPEYHPKRKDVLPVQDIVG